MPSSDNDRVGDRITIKPRGKKKFYSASFWQDGEHKRVSLKTANRKVAIQHATKIAAELHEGCYRPAPTAIGFQSAAESYITTLKTNGRARKTTVKYEGIFRIFAEFLDRRRVAKLHQVTAVHFDSWRTERQAIRHAKTVFTESVVVKQLFKWSKLRKLILEDPLAGLALNKPPLVPKCGPSLNEVDAILASAEAPLRNWLVVLAFSGLRVGELQRLRAEDVDLAGNWIHVRSRPGAETKTRTSRKVPIHARLRAEFLSMSRPRQEGWFFTAEASPKYPEGGNWINCKRVNDQLARLLARLDLPTGREAGFTVHSLRHFFETITVNAAIPQRVVDAWMGHSSDRSMAAVYYRLLDVESQLFMSKVPFGTGEPAAPAGEEETK